MTEPLKVVVDRSRWARGSSGPSYLLIPERHRDDPPSPNDARRGHMCCLGFVACALGYTPDQIRDELTPAGAYDVHEILWPGQGDRPVALPAYDDAMSMNDLSTYAAGGEERREARLTEILAAVDIELSFVDGPL